MTMRPTLLLWLLLCSCANDTEPFVLAFPSIEAFVYSETARIYAVEIDDAAGVCRDLLFQVESVGPIAAADVDTGPIPVCDFESGAVELPAIESGLRAYVATARDGNGRVILSGCSIRDVHADGTNVTITLAPTDSYRALIGTPEYVPPTCTVEQRCGGGCT